MNVETTNKNLMRLVLERFPNEAELLKDYLTFLLWEGNGTIPPWTFTNLENIESAEHGILKRYPKYQKMTFFPFAYRGIDDIAVFVLQGDSIIVRVIHYGATDGDETDIEYSSFSDWLKGASEYSLKNLLFREYRGQLDGERELRISLPGLESPTIGLCREIL